jgi:hypothetical protein
MTQKDSTASTKTRGTGTGKPRQKPKCPSTRLTELQKEQRVDFAANLLINCHVVNNQIAAICKEYGIKTRQAKRYLAKARKRILKASRRPRERWYAKQLEFYEAIVDNPLVSIKDRLAAGKRIDKLTGLEAPLRVEVADTREQELDEKLEPATNQELMDLLGVLEDRNSLCPPPSAN